MKYDNPPSHQTIKELNSSFQREKRTFGIIVLLMIATAIITASITIAGRINKQLEWENNSLRIAYSGIKEFIEYRQMSMVAFDLLFQATAPDTTLNLSSRYAGSKCQLLSPSLSQNERLENVCNEIIERISLPNAQLPLLILSLDGKSAYINSSFQKNNNINEITSKIPTKLLAQNLYAYAKNSDTTMQTGGKIAWISPPSITGINRKTILGIAIIKEKKVPKVLAITSISINEIHNVASPLPRNISIALTDYTGKIVDSDLSLATAAKLQENLAPLRPNRYYWIRDYGWASLSSQVVPGFGRFIVSISYWELFDKIWRDVAIIFLITLSLVIFLLCVFKYWSKNYLKPAYTRAAQALEMDMLNHFLVHTIPVGLCVLERPSLNLIFSNQVASSLVLKNETGHILPIKFRELFEQSQMQHQGGSPIEQIGHFQYSFNDPLSHKMIYLEVIYSPAILEQNDVYFCAINDVTQHYEAKSILEEARKTSEQAAKAKINFFAAMSHEIRTPLASLVGNIELITKEGYVGKQENRIHAMHSSAQNLLRIVNDVLDFSKMDLGEMKIHKEWTSLTRIFKQTALIYSAMAIQKGVNFYIFIDRNIPELTLFDPIRLSQIINNILSNSFKFTSSGKVAMNASWENSILCISITDSGMGMPESIKGNLFKPFTQANNLSSTQGTGLGLSICHRLCLLMDGQIKIESTEGVGTRVEIKIPLEQKGNTVSGEKWGIHLERPLIICRARENKEWLMNLIVSTDHSIVVSSELNEIRNISQFDYIFVTDEFELQDIQHLIDQCAKIIYIKKDGALKSRKIKDNISEANLYDPRSIKQAIENLKNETSNIKQEDVPSEHLHSNINILIAEDNKLNRELLIDQLKHLGIHAIGVENGKEALIELKKGYYNAVFTDIDMPVMDGYELTRKIKTIRPAMPVFAISASAKPDKTARNEGAEFTDYLMKPVELEDLHNIIENHFSHDKKKSHHPYRNNEELTPNIPEKYLRILRIEIKSELEKIDGIIHKKDMALLVKWTHKLLGGFKVLGQSDLSEKLSKFYDEIKSRPHWDANTDIELSSIIEELIKISEFEPPPLS
ncbi:ATP-binding protein [Chromobacterium haemolyticum]|uniref:ATP-binding protein n=1 Tax=Chromobacterium haemolyticum TaxID=394935 RepID=UPI000DEFB286|nr:ATP-binding protein [Chromobacterium haemolyticum]